MKYKKSRFFKGLSLLVAIATLAWSIPVYADPDPNALPEGYTPGVGNTSYTTDGAVGTFHSNDPATTGFWNSFNIGSGARFDAYINNVHLSKVIGGDPSQIFGAMNVHSGKFFLVNTNGIFFAPGSQVNASGLVASSLDINEQDFLAGNYKFFQAGDPSFVTNQGDMNIGAGGLALLGGAVANQGVIVANESSAVLASGEEMTLSLDGQGLLQAQVDRGVAKTVKKADGSDATDGVLNTGVIRADGGKVVMTAEATNDIFASLVNNRGIVEAQSIGSRNGKIELSSKASAGVVQNSGKLTAKGNDTGEKGGQVHVTGEKVGLFAGSDIDASGDSGGGEVLIGGDYQGLGTLRNADFTVMAPGTKISADALVTGNGGKVILWADQATRAYGEISAKGGALSGDGGFVETSGHDYLDVAGIRVDAGAPNGEAGLWLLDPSRNIDIDDVATSGGSFDSGDPNIFTPTANNSKVNTVDIEASLNNGTDVTIVTGTSGSPQAGDVSIKKPVEKTAGTDAKFRIEAENNITIETAGKITSSAGSLAVELISAAGTILISNVITTLGGNVLLSAADGITLNNTNSDINTGGGSFTADGNTDLDNAGDFNMSHAESSLNTGTGEISISGRNVLLDGLVESAANAIFTATAGQFRLTNLLSSGGGDVTINAADDINLNGTDADITTGGGKLTATANTDADSLGDFSQSHSGSLISTSGGNVSVTGRKVDLDGSTTSGAGNIDLTATNSYVRVANTITTTGGNVTLTAVDDIRLSGSSGDVNTGGGDFTAIADSDLDQAGIFDQSSSSSLVDVGSGNILIKGHDYQSTGVLTGTGTLTIQPSTIARDINIGSNGDFSISNAEVSNWSEGFSQITVGRVDGTGLVTVADADFKDPIKIQAGGVGGRVNVTGPITTTDDHLTLAAGTTNTGLLSLGSAATIHTGTGGVTLEGDSVSIDPATTITTTGDVNLRPASDDRPIVVAGAGSASDFALSTAELATIANGANKITIGRSTGAHEVTVNAVTFNDPITIQSPFAPGEINVNGQITGADNASVTLIGSGATTNLAANIITHGNAINLMDNVVLLVNILLDTTNGGVLPGADITVNGTIDGTTPGMENLTLRAGAGNILLDGAVGAGVRLGDLLIQSVNDFTAKAIKAASITQADGTGTSIFNGVLDTDTIINALGIDLTGNKFIFNADVNTSNSGNVEISNTGELTINDGSDMTLNGGFLQNGAGPVTYGGTITTTNGDVRFASPITLNHDAAIDTSSGNGDITFHDLIEGAFDLLLSAGSGNIIFGGPVGALGAPIGDLVIQSAFNVTAGDIFANSLTQVSGTGLTDITGDIHTYGVDGIHLTGFDIRIGDGLGDDTVITENSGPLYIDHSGSLIINSDTDGVSGPITFIGGDPVTPPPGGGDDDEDLVFEDAIVLTMDTIFNAHHARIKFKSTVDTNGFHLTLIADEIDFLDSIFSSTIGLSDLLLIPFTPTLDINLGGLADTGALDLTLTELGLIQDGFRSLTIGSPTGSGNISFNGPTTWVDPTVFQAPSAGGSFTVNQSIAGLGNASLTFLGSGNTMALGADITTAGTNIQINDSIILTDDVNLDTTSGGASGANIGVTGTINGTSDGEEDLGLTAGDGNITLGNAVGNNTRIGALTVNSAADLTTHGIKASSITQTTDTTGTTIHDGVLDTDTAAGIDLAGGVFNFTPNSGIKTTNAGGFALDNSGTATFNSSSDMDLDGAFSQTGTGSVTTGADIKTTSDNISFASPVTLTDHVSLDSTGGDITFSGVVEGTLANAQNLTLASGAGNILFSSTVGAGTALGDILIKNVADATFNGAVDASSIVQEAGSGTTAFNRRIDISSNKSIDLTGNNFTFGDNSANDQTVNIASPTNGGVTIKNSGNLTINEPADFNIDGDFHQVSGGAFSRSIIGGDITTSNDKITFDSAVRFIGSLVSLSTGPTIGADITFNQAVDSTSAGAQDLTLSAKTGNVLFNDQVGSIARLGDLTIQDAHHVTFNDNVRVSSITQNAGTGTTTLNGTLNTNTSTNPLGLDLTGNAFTFNGDVTTLNNGGVEVTNAGDLNVNADMTLNGDFIQNGSGDVNLGGSITTLASDVNFASDVTLTQSSLIDTSADNGNVTFQGTVNGLSFASQNLVIDAGNGDIDFQDSVGTFSPLLTLDVTGGTINLQDVVTAGPQRYTGNTTLNGGGLTSVTAGEITLDGNVTLATDVEIETAGSSTADDVIVTGTIETDGTARSLKITAGLGDIDLQDSTGAVNNLSSIDLSGTNVNVHSVDTTSSQKYTGETTLNDDLTSHTAGSITVDGDTHLATGPIAVTTAGAEADDITFTGDIDGAQALTLNAGAAGDVFVGGEIGYGPNTPLSSLLITAQTMALNSVKTTGSQTYNGASFLSGNFESLTSGAIWFNGAATLEGDTSVHTYGATNTDDIIFSSTIDGSHDLTLETTGLGDIQFGGAVGSNTPPSPIGHLKIKYANDVTAGDIAAASILQEAGTGHSNFTGDLYTTDPAGISIAGNDITIGSLPAGSNVVVTLAGGPLCVFNSGTFTLNSNIDGVSGGFKQLGSGPVIINLPNIDADFDIIFTGFVTLADDLTLNARTHRIAFLGGAELGGFDLSLTADEIDFTDGVGTDLLSSSAAGSDLLIQPFTTTLDIILGGVANTGAMDLTASDILQIAHTASNFNSLTIGSAVGSGTMSFTAPTTWYDVTTFRAPGTGGAFDVNGVITGLENASLTFLGSGATMDLGANIITAGLPILIMDSVRLTADVILSAISGVPTGADITITGVVNGTSEGAEDLELRAGTTGNILLGGAVGAGTRIGHLLVSNVHNWTSNGITASRITQTTSTSGLTTFNGKLDTDASQGISLTGQAFDFNANLAVKTANGGGVTIINSGALTVDSAADMDLDGAFSQSGGGAVTTGGDIKTTADNISFANAVTLSNDVNLNSQGGNITFSGTVNSSAGVAKNLTLASGLGNILFSSAVGGGTRIGNLLVKNAENVTFTDDVTTNSIIQETGTGITTFNEDVDTNNAAGINLTGNNFTFGNLVNTDTVTTSDEGGVTITNSGTLTVNSNSVFTLDGNFTQNNGGPVSLVNLAGDITTTSDDITFGSDVTLTNTATVVDLSTGAGVGNISFNRSLTGTSADDSDMDLTAGAGSILFNGRVGAVSLGDLDINSAHNVTFNDSLTAESLVQNAGTGVTTLNGPALIEDNIDLTGNDFVFNDTVTTQDSGAGNVEVTHAGTLDINGDFTLQGDFVENGAGDVELGGDITTLSSDVTFNNDVTLTQNVTVNSSADNGNVTFQGAVDGSTTGTQSLTVSAGFGDVNFNDSVGSITQLLDLTVSGSPIVLQDVTTTGSQSYTGTGFGTTLNGDLTSTDNGSITITGTTAFNGNRTIQTAGSLITDDITFTGAVNGAGSLDVHAGIADVDFQGAVGNTTALSRIGVEANTINLQSVRTNGSQSYTGTTTLNGNLTSLVSGPITVDGDTHLATGPIAVTTAGAEADDITFTGDIDGAQALTLNAGAAGDVFVGGEIGYGPNTPLSSLLITAQTIALNSVKTEGSQTYNGASFLNGDLESLTSGAISFNGAVTLEGDSSVYTHGASNTDDILFSSTIDGPYDLSLRTTGLGDIVFGGAVGGGTRIGDLKILNANDVTSGNISAASILQAAGTGHTNIDGSLFTTDPAGISLASVDITLGGLPAGSDTVVTLAGGPLCIFNSGTFTLNANINGVSGPFKQLGSGPVVINVPDINIDGDIIFAGFVTLVDDLDLNAADNLIAFYGGAQLAGFDLSLTADDIDFTDGVGVDLLSSNTPGSDLVIQPFTPSLDINIGGLADTGVMDLTAADILQIAHTASNFNSVTIGSAIGNGKMSFNSATTWYDPMTFRTPEAGGVFDVNALITGLENATLTFLGSGGTMSLGANIVTAGLLVNIVDSVILTNDILIDTTNAGGSAGANIDITGTVEGTSDGAENLVLTAGTGAIVLGNTVGAGTRVGQFIVNSAMDLTTHGIKASSIDQTTDVTGTTTHDGELNTDTAAGIDLTGGIFNLTPNSSVKTTNNGAFRLDNTGTASINSSSDLDLDGAFDQVGSGEVTIGAGIKTTDDNISFASNVELTADTLTFDSTGGNINFGGTVNDDGVGTPAEVILNAIDGDITFSDAVGSTDALNTLLILTADDVNFDGTVNTLSHLTQLTGTGTTTFSDTATIGGNVDILTEAISFDGLGNLVSNSGNGHVVLTATTGAISSGTGLSDVTASTLVASAASGVGTTGNPLRTSIDNLEAFGGMGGVFVTNSSGAVLTIGEIGAMTGVSTLDGNIVIKNESPIEIKEDIVNAGSGNITVAALGNDATDDLRIFADVLATGGSGDIRLIAGDTINVSSDVVISARAGGDITLAAGEDFSDNIFNQDGHADGSIILKDGSIVKSGEGDILLDARDDVSISFVDANADGGPNMGDVTIFARSGSITENTFSETENIKADVLSMTAGQGIGTTGLGDIDTFVNLINADSTVAGDIFITETNAVTLNNIDTNNGNITIVTGGDTLVNSMVSDSGVAGSHDIDLTVNAGDLTVGLIQSDDAATVNVPDGSINSTTDNAVADIVASIINLFAGQGGIGNSSVVDVTAGTQFNADTTADNSNITVDSIGALPIGLVTTGSTTQGVVTIESTGAIDESAPEDAGADILAKTVNLTALSGGVGMTRPLEITSGGATINIDTTGDGSGIAFNSLGDAVIGLVTTGGAGNVTITSTGRIDSEADDATADIVGNVVDLSADGAIGGNSPLDITATGNLKAVTTNDDILIDSIGNLTIDLVNAGTGDVTLDSTGFIRGLSEEDATADVVGGTVNLTALAGGIGTGVFNDPIASTYGLDVQVSEALNTNTATDNGDQFIHSTQEDLPLGLLNAGEGDVRLDSAGDITDANGASNNLNADDVVLKAVETIGTALNKIESTLSEGITIAELQAIVTGPIGGIFIANTGALTLSDITAFGASLSAPGSIDVSTGSPLTVISQVISTDGGDITLSANGSADADDLSLMNEDTDGTGVYSLAKDTNLNGILDKGDVITTGGSGSVRLIAGDTVSIDPGVTVSAVSTGDVSLHAGEDFADGILDQDGNAGGDILMKADVFGPGGTLRQAIVNAEEGDITADARDNIELTLLNADSNANGVRGDVTVNARGGAITDVNDLLTDALNILGDTLTLNAALGIGTPSNPIEIIANTLIANGGSGPVDLVNQSGDPILVSFGNSAANFTLITLGTILLDTITAANIFLSAAGDILDANGNEGNLTAGQNAHLSAGGVIGRYFDPIDVNITGDLTVLSQSAKDQVSVMLHGFVGGDLIFNLTPGLVFLNNIARGGDPIEFLNNGFATAFNLIAFDKRLGQPYDLQTLQGLITNAGWLRGLEKAFAPSIDMTQFDEQPAVVVNAREARRWIRVLRPTRPTVVPTPTQVIPVEEVTPIEQPVVQPVVTPTPTPFVATPVMKPLEQQPQVVQQQPLTQPTPVKSTSWADQMRKLFTARRESQPISQPMMPTGTRLFQQQVEETPTVDKAKEEKN